MADIMTLDWYRSQQTRVVADLAKPELLMLLATRWWVRCFGTGEDPIPRLTQALGRGGAHDAGFSIDGLMAIVARTGQRPIDVRCPRCPQMSDDEAVLLHAAHLAQQGRVDLAERHLRLHLLTPPGAAFAVGPLQGIAALFAAAGLTFGRRRADDPRGVRPYTEQAAWIMPEGCSNAIH
jgi:hypothetical protein